MRMIDPERLSNYEFCATYELNCRTLEPPRLPVREGVKRYFRSGVQGLTESRPDAIESTARAFLDHAASPGFQYPSDNWQKDWGNHPPTDVYSLANDYCSWLEAALFIAQERIVPGANLWRIVDRFESRMHWDELMALTQHSTVTVHYFRLPALRQGRLSSPLCLAYLHPLKNYSTGIYRLATLEGETKFNNNWKRVARWELRDEIEWAEWRFWIERDDCMRMILQETLLGPIDQKAADEILRDADRLEQAIASNTEPPRYREACEKGCMFKDYCHGDGEGFMKISALPIPTSLSI